MEERKCRQECYTSGTVKKLKSGECRISSLGFARSNGSPLVPHRSYNINFNDGVWSLWTCAVDLLSLCLETEEALSMRLEEENGIDGLDVGGASISIRLVIVITEEISDSPVGAVRGGAQ